MSPLIGWALAMAQGLPVPAAPPVVTRLASVALATLAAGVSEVAAVACGLASLWIYALPYAGPGGAPLIVAGVLAAVTLTACAVGRHALRTAPPPVVPVPAFPIAEALALINEHKGSALLAAVIAGMAAGTCKK